ncbi:MAG: lipid-A-disaccharide synthase [Opitutales bacterium]
MNVNLQFHSPPDGQVDLLVVAGEVSGDEHGSELVSGLFKRQPDLTISAVGGGELEKKGAHLVYPLVDHAVVGFFEVIKNYQIFKQIFSATIQWIKKFQPRTVLLIDYPGFNLRLAKELKKLGLSRKGGGDILVLQYISPQLWAWKPKRRFVMEKILDGLGVIFPFEVACYEDTNLPVSFVGHPFVQPGYQNSISYDPKGPLLILPGSRVQPVQRILPVFLDTVSELLKDFPDLEIVLPVPDLTIRNLADHLLSLRSNLKGRVRVVIGKAGIKARAALMSSGTMSLSCAIAGIPGVIAYRAHPLTYLLGRTLIRIPHLGMANILLADDPPYPEFLQGRANGRVLSRSMTTILKDSHSGKNSAEVAKKIIKSLQVTTDRGAEDWIAQETSRV